MSHLNGSKCEYVELCDMWYVFVVVNVVLSMEMHLWMRMWSELMCIRCVCDDILDESIVYNF
jgi:hypothetical protein